MGLIVTQPCSTESRTPASLHMVFKIKGERWAYVPGRHPGAGSQTSPPPLKGHHCPRCARSCESMSEWREGVSFFAPAPCTCSALLSKHLQYPGSGGRPLLGLPWLSQGGGWGAWGVAIKAERELDRGR